MGKRIIARARGRGGPRYRAPSHRYRGRAEYAKTDGVRGVVKDIVQDPGRSSPVAIVQLESGERLLQIAPEGLYVGDAVEYGGEAKVGNVLKLADLAIGTKVSAVEIYYGSGPKFCRSSGSFATIVAAGKGTVTLQFSSGKLRDFNSNCRATVGVPAAGGRLEKPWAKGGKHAYAMGARGKIFPRSVGVAMSPVDHPFGGRKKAARPSKSVSRHAPPGSKVGSISPRRVGRRKRL